MQETRYQIKGMSQDLANQLFNPQYAFECRNIRINATDENSLLSLTNERGNKSIGTIINPMLDSNATNFKVLGIGQFSDYCIIFGTTGSEYKPDYIIRLSNNGAKILIRGHLNFNKDNPIKTVCVYENDKVQKVYWIDGINPPRVLNVANYTDEDELNNQKLNFLPKLSFNEKVSITKTSGGLFPAGVIQYAFTYSDKNLQESNLWYVSPLYYITEPNRGAEAGKSCNTAFKIGFTGIDTTFDYIQIYVIIRTSLNATPQCYKIANIQTDTTSFTDTGSYWEACSVEEIIGKQLGTFIPSTMATKDSTLFLGNYTIASPLVEENNYIRSIKDSLDFEFKPVNLDNNKLEIKERSVKTFRSGEHYRFGIQFMDEYGTPSNVLYLKDIQAPIADNSNNGIFAQKVIKATLGENPPTTLTNNFKRCRLLMVDRTNLPHRTLCQGVLCPTVYTPIDRVNNAPFAMSSWCMRGYSKDEDTNKTIRWKGNRALWDTHRKIGGELANQRYNDTVSGDHYDEKVSPWDNKLITVDTATRNGVNIVYYHMAFYRYWDSANTQFESYGGISIRFKVCKSSEPTMEYSDILEAEPTIAGSKYFQNLVTFCNWENYGSYKLIASLKAAIKDKIINGLIKDGAPHPELVANSLIYQRFEASHTTISKYTDILEWSKNNMGETGTVTSEWDSESWDFNTALRVANENINPFYCDHNIITFHSPDVVKYSTIIDGNSNIKYRAVGYTCMENSYFDHYIIATPSDGHARAGEQPYIKQSKGGLGNASLWRGAYLYPIYIWHRDKKLQASTTDNKGVWSKKVMSNVHKCGDSYAFTTALPTVSNNFEDCVFPEMGIPRVFNQDDLGGLNLDNQPYSTNRHRKLVYFGNVKTLHSIGGSPYSIIYEKDNGDYSGGISGGTTSDPCSIQYKSTPHVVMPMSYICKPNGNSTNIYSSTLPYSSSVTYTQNTKGYIWATDVHGIHTPSIMHYIPDNILKSNNPILYIAELYQDINAQDIYGGTTSDSIAKHTWIPISDWINIESNGVLEGYGDIFIGRWECLKTYPFSVDDSQSYVDITSFIVESDTNLSSRCDSYKETVNATNLDASKFNIFNPVYDQQNNLFNYASFSSFENVDNFQNQICWSGVKTLGEETDSWCRINVGNNMDLQGEHGQLRSIVNFNNNLYCFQDNAIYKLNYNTRVAITPSDGGPIQLSNNYNIDPPLLLNSNYGVSSFKHIAKGTAALYILDNKRKRLLSLDSKDTVTELSTVKGVNSLIPKLGTPTQVTVDTNIKDIYFNFSNIALGFNEDLMEFTSLYDYHTADFIFSMDENTYAIKGNNLYVQRQGNYGEFFIFKKPYYVELLMNEHPTKVKTFTNLEFNMDSDSADAVFDQINVSTSYQEAEETLSWSKLRPSNLKRKFRLWRIDVPRDKINSFDRMRDTWCKVRLTKRASTSLKKARVNHISISYNID